MTNKMKYSTMILQIYRRVRQILINSTVTINFFWINFLFYSIKFINNQAQRKVLMNSEMQLHNSPQIAFSKVHIFEVICTRITNAKNELYFFSVDHEYDI